MDTNHIKTITQQLQSRCRFDSKYSPHEFANLVPRLQVRNPNDIVASGYVHNAVKSLLQSGNYKCRVSVPSDIESELAAALIYELLSYKIANANLEMLLDTQADVDFGVPDDLKISSNMGSVIGTVGELNDRVAMVYGEQYDTVVVSGNTFKKITKHADWTLARLATRLNMHIRVETDYYVTGLDPAYKFPSPVCKQLFPDDKVLLLDSKDFGKTSAYFFVEFPPEQQNVCLDLTSPFIYKAQSIGESGLVETLNAVVFGGPVKIRNTCAAVISVL